MDTHLDTPPRLQLRRVSLDALQTDPANARSHGPENMAAIEASLARFGQAEPLIVQKGSGRVIGGNGRLAAMRSLGWSECDVAELDLGDTEAAALGIALNRTGELAEWDDDALARILRGLQSEGSLDGVGFDDGDLDDLITQLGTESLDLQGDDEAPPSEITDSPVTRDGDMWTIGEHKLLCGDATDPGCYSRIVGDEQADLVWTDPPYGVSYEGKTEDALTIENDALDGTNLEALLDSAFRAALVATKPGGVWYIAAPAGPNFLAFARPLLELGVWRQTLVWLKDAFVLGRSDYHYRHEAIFYGWKPGAAHHAPATRKQDTVWEHQRPRANDVHPTMKPLDLIARAVINSTRTGELVLDPFCGSGSTLLACAQASRRGVGIELDPRYCDATLQRLEAATGMTPTLDGLSFTEIKEERHGQV